MSLAREKARLRRELAARRRGVAPSVAAAVSQAVADHVAGSREFQAARAVVLYAALPDEVPTGALRSAAARAGKRMLWPRSTPDGRLEFAALERVEDLRPGRYGVLEPLPEIPAEPVGRGDLVLVPGVAFDRDGRRLGRGGGFYDRTFPALVGSAPALFGVAYAFQVVDAVPAGRADRPVDAIVTENGLYRVGAEGARP